MLVRVSEQVAKNYEVDFTPEMLEDFKADLASNSTDFIQDLYNKIKDIPHHQFCLIIQNENESIYGVNDRGWAYGLSDAFQNFLEWYIPNNREPDEFFVYDTFAEWGDPESFTADKLPF